MMRAADRDLLPPHDDEAEDALLGLCIISAAARDLGLTEVKPEYFFDPARRVAFEVIRELHRQGRTIEQMTVRHALRARPELGSEDTSLLIHGFISAAGTTSQVGEAARVLRDLWHQREQIRLGSEFVRVASNGHDPKRLAMITDQLQTIGRGVAIPDVSNRIGPLENLSALLESPPAAPMPLISPEIPRSRRVWAFGAAESGKSIYAAWIAARLTRGGERVVYVSEENPLEEELRRLRRLGIDSQLFDLISGSGIDLASPADSSRLIEISEGAALVVLDTLSSCWSGDENDNAAVAALDREVLAPLASAGTTVLILDHTGHPQAFTKRAGATAGRGASSKGQKADVVLNFEGRGESEFRLSVGKMRGGARPPRRRLRVVDRDDGGLEVIEAGPAENHRIAEMADAMVNAIASAAAEYLTTNQLRGEVAGFGGKELQTEAMRVLEAENPPRVVASREVVDTGRGRQSAKTWRISKALAQ